MHAMLTSHIDYSTRQFTYLQGQRGGGGIVKPLVYFGGFCYTFLVYVYLQCFI